MNLAPLIGAIHFVELLEKLIELGVAFPIREKEED